MADHADANPTKGAGKSPRVPRTTRKASLLLNKSPLSSSTSAIRDSIPTKRKSRNRDTNDLRERKISRVEELNSKSRSSRSSSSNQSAVRKQKEDYRSSGRYLRKRKRNIELRSSSSDSDSATTDPEEEDLVLRVDNRSHLTYNNPPSSLPEVSSTVNTSKSSSGGATCSSGGHKSTSSNKDVSQNNKQSSGRNSERKLQTQQVQQQSNSSSSSGSKSQRREKVHKGNKRIEHSDRPTPADSQDAGLESTCISSRLRLTPSRAAAAASQKAAAELGSLKQQKSNNSSTSTTKSRHNSKSTAEHNINKKKSHQRHEERKIILSSDTDDLTEDGDLPGPSSKCLSQQQGDEHSRSGFRYQLRSRTSIDGSQTHSSSSSSGKEQANKKERSSSQRKDSVSSGLRGAHILSEKEKGLRRSSSKGGGGEGNLASNSSSAVSGVQSTSSGRSNTTGSCASSRCGRGGGPSSTEGPSSVTVKSGEPGMNNSSSSSGQQSTSSSSRVDQTDGGSSVTATAAGGTTGTASAAAASAFSRGLAMLSGETDADEGEMGRLQALLESRGLPPHLFGSLAPRMQQLLHRGISNSTGNVTKAQQLLQGLQATGDEGQQLQAAIEMCQLLVMGNEDTLAGFPVKQTVPALIQLLSMEHNFDIMNHACRALTYMMEALPRSTPVVAEAVPVFLEKLQVIQCMDVAEQSLTALEMLSRRHAKAILQARGVSACLTFLDFFSIVAQRASLSITANCMQNLHAEEFPLVADSLHFMATRLTQQDKKSVESTCLAFSRLVDSFNADPKRLEEIASPELLANLQQLLVVTPPVVSTGTFILVLRMLAQLCARSPSIAVKLLEQNIVGTLSSLLLGSSGSSAENVLEDVELVARNPQELLEIVGLIAELLPKLPKDGIFIVNTMMANPQMTTQDAVQWQWKDDRSQWNSYSPFDSRIIEAAHQSGEDEISLSMQGRTYTVDFLGMQQINEDTGTARTVQRKVNPFYCLKSGGSAGVTSESQDKSAVPDDERSSYLAVHPDFSLSFLRPLFALLSEANSSSAGPAVRQSCLKTLLRIVHFLPSESLQKVLKPQVVSNNLASMLGSSDLKIVVGSFQLCCLFMEKLHEDFLTHFRREGVFHQISRISSSEVVGPSPMKSDISALLGMSPPGSMTSVSAAGSSSNISAAGGVSNNLNNVSGAVSSTSSMTVLPSVPHLPIPVMNVNVPVPPPLTPLQMQIQPMSMHHHPHVHVPHLPPSPYSLCVGGFFMQQPGGMSNLVSGSPAPGTNRSDNGNFVSGLNLSTVLEASRGSAAHDPSSGRGDIINVQPSGSHGVTNVVSSITSVIHTSSVNTGSTSSSVPQVEQKSTDHRTGSGTSSSDSNTESSGGSASRSGSSSGHEKKLEQDSPQAVYDAFRRKRVSKRPIPTSTSRKLRQEDPAGMNSANPGNSNNSTGSSANGASSGKRGGKSGFFASLHPSRWTRGSGNNGSSGSSSNNNTTNAVANLHADRSHHVSLHVGGPGGMSFTSSSRSHNVNSVFTVSYKEQVKTWLKEQSLAFTTKYCRHTSESGVSEPGAIADDEVGVLPKLTEIIQHLRQESKMIEALKELRSVILESDISSFEINHSGLISALLGFLTDDSGYKSSRDSRLRSFIHTFAECPLNYLSGEELDAYIGARSGGNALSSLVAKLNSCLAQVEQFQVKVHEVPTSSGGSRAAPTSALRFFNTHQLKCTLQRHPSCSTLRQWKGGPVKIDSLALVQTIERYLIAKGFGRVRESRDSGDSEDDNSDDDIDDTLAAAVISQGNARHKLQFLMGDHVLPYNMTVYQAIRQFGMGSSDPSGELEAELDPSSALLGSSGIWAQTHTIYYRPVPEDGSSSNASSTTASKSKKSKAPSAKNTSKNKKDPLWHEGQVSDPLAPYLMFLSGKLPDSVTITDPCLPVLTLLRVIHAVCRFWRYLYWPVLSGQPLLPQSEFINTKVAAKAQRQLQDPVVIMTGNVPQWLQQIGVCCPFLFPFETRQMLFYSITFDRDRALQRLLDSVPELNSSEREDRVTPRLDRRKRTISRDNILHHAEQLMSDFGSSRPLLEIQYENEVGTGLGPTLEFYALVSQELQKKELDLWHCESSVDVTIPDEAILDSKAKNYVHTSVGLFPKPLGKSVKAGNVSKVKTKFKFLGKFMAKAVMDSRMIDLPLSNTLYKWILTGESSMCLADICDVDSTIARSIRHLVSVVSQKKKLESKYVANDLNVALESLTLDGCRIDNLGLDFTLPGHPSIDLKKGGKDIPVTIHNLEDYVKLVCHWMLLGGVFRQMEAWKEGFDSVFPSSSLKMFYPEELEMIFCGANQSTNENWDVKTLMECCRADHGYTLESKAIQFLFEIMSSYDASERRKFVQFVTGSPRLPVGGFKSLQPQLTIVRKTIEGQLNSDSYLPSVMTCVNYLKLPDYSTLEAMRDRLQVAVDEGQLSFHLS